MLEGMAPADDLPWGCREERPGTRTGTGRGTGTGIVDRRDRRPAAKAATWPNGRETDLSMLMGPGVQESRSPRRVRRDQPWSNWLDGANEGFARAGDRAAAGLTEFRKCLGPP